jgi:hypothetical protein
LPAQHDVCAAVQPASASPRLSGMRRRVAP